MTTMDARFWVFFALGLLSLSLFMGGAFQWWKARARHFSQHRLSEAGAKPLPQRIHISAPRNASQWVGASPRLQALLTRLPGMERYERYLHQTGWRISGAESILGSVALAIAVITASTLMGNAWALSMLGALIAVLSAHAVLVWRHHHRARLLELQLPDALSLIARSMQAGHAFSSALQIAGQESPSPMGGELRGVFHEIQYGESASDALSHWAERVAGEDVRIFVIAVRIQNETGGNLAELLHQTAALIRERQKLRGTVRVLSAEGRISALILTLLPFGLAGLLSALNPAFMAQLWTDSMGIRMLALALGQMGIGMLWMWQLVRMQP